MKNYLKYISRFIIKIFNILASLKTKLKHMIFNLLDAVQELTGEWYYLSFDIKTVNGKDHFQIPMFACMRNETDANSLQNQIQKDLIYHFHNTKSSIDRISAERKDAMIADLELKFTSNDKYYLRTIIYKAIGKKVKNMNAQLFDEDDLSIGNLDFDTNYIQENTIPFRIKIIKNQGVPLHQILDFFVINIDKKKTDPLFSIPEPKTPLGDDMNKSNKI